MNQIKPLDQVPLIGADPPNHTTKVINKFGSKDCILSKLKEFSSSIPDFRRSWHTVIKNYPIGDESGKGNYVFT